MSIYLGKGGKAFGPYSEQEFESLQSSGAIRQYTWIWSAKRKEWQPLDPAPAPLDLSSSEIRREFLAPEIPLTGEPRQQLLFRQDVIVPIEAICHDSRTVVSGQLHQVTEIGCDLVSITSLHGACFATNAPILLNLLDPKTGRSVNIPARINGISRKSGAWRFRISWKNCPKIVRDSVAA